METFIHQVVAGIATGGVYASLALALVMIYQSTHHINFAQGEIAMFATYMAWTLINRTGDVRQHSFPIHRRDLTEPTAWEQSSVRPVNR